MICLLKNHKKEMRKKVFANISNKLLKIIPLQIILSLILQIGESLQPALLVIVEARFIDGVIAFFENQSVSMGYLVCQTILLILLMAYVWVSSDIIQYIDAVAMLKLRNTYKPHILSKVAAVKYAYMEDEKTCELISRISKKPEEELMHCYISYRKILSFILRIGSILFLLSKYALGSTLLLLLLTIPLFILAVKTGKANYEVTKEVTQYSRIADYLSNVLTSRESAYERTMFSYGEKINDMWSEKFDIARKKRLKATFVWFVKTKVGSVVTALIGVIVTLVLLPNTLNGTISVGIYISLLNAIYAMVGIMSWEFTDCVDQLANTNEYIKEYEQFLALEADEKLLSQSLESENLETIVFDNVSFHYPNSTDYILHNLSLKFERNKQYSLVGVNGAGKTTIIKLLLKLYDDYEGNIYINGIELREYSSEKIKALFSVVFQDFAKYYYLTIGENISIGSRKSISQDQLLEVVEKMGLSDWVSKLPDGLNTRLGSNFEAGIDVSGGQWQRIAIARGMIGNSAVCVLDEPTAALDPIVERDFYDSIRWIRNEKSLIIVTHRLATTKASDCIYVIENGTVVEEGGFEELLACNGKFAMMYEKQRSWYDEKE